MKRTIAGAFFLTSQLGCEYSARLEEVFFFNANQWKLREDLRRVVEGYGTPQIRNRNERLCLEFEALPQAQTLYLMKGEAQPELAGVVCFVREGALLKVLYIGLMPQYTYPQFSEPCLLAAMLVLTCNDRRYSVWWGVWQDAPLLSVVVRRTGKNLNDWPGVGPNPNK